MTGLCGWAGTCLNQSTCGYATRFSLELGIPGGLSPLCWPKPSKVGVRRGIAEPKPLKVGVQRGTPSQSRRKLE